MKFCILTLLGLTGLAHATVSIELQFGTLRDSSAVTVADGALWAVIYQNNSGNLPGGLENNSSLSSGEDENAIQADFAGMVINVGEIINGSRILLTGTIDGGFVQGTVWNFDIAALGVTTGESYGLYWFPGLTTASNTLPSSGNFEVGGFNELAADPNAGGQSGMVIPADSFSGTTAYFDTVTSSGSTSTPVSRFIAVAVPEPSTLALSALGLAALLRRRRN